MSTHLVVVYTSNTGNSRWVPYELGRAKDRLPRAGNAAFWHDQHPMPSYSYLVQRFDRGKDVAAFKHWISMI
jgi:hypothetical protein